MNAIPSFRTIGRQSHGKNNQVRPAETPARSDQTVARRATRLASAKAASANAIAIAADGLKCVYAQ